MKVLVAEDDRHTREGLAEVLACEGYEVVTACDGREALRLFRTQKPDFVCLDVMMPGVDGYSVCKAIRQENSKVPIIFISAKSEEIDKVLGLELGGDDFIVKPFGIKEVLARIRAVTRRCLAAEENPTMPESFQMADLTVYPAQLRAQRGEQVIDLSLREVKLLYLFYQNSGRVLSRNALFDYCWGEDYVPESRTLDQHISQLRKKIERDPKHPVVIRTVHGIGYRYDPSTPPQQSAS